MKKQLTSLLLPFLCINLHAQINLGGESSESEVSRITSSQTAPPTALDVEKILNKTKYYVLIVTMQKIVNNPNPQVKKILSQLLMYDFIKATIQNNVYAISAPTKKSEDYFISQTNDRYVFAGSLVEFVGLTKLTQHPSKAGVYVATAQARIVDASTIGYTAGGWIVGNLQSFNIEVIYDLITNSWILQEENKLTDASPWYATNAGRKFKFMYQFYAYLPSYFIGTWATKSGKHKYVMNEDGTFSYFKNDDLKNSGTYKHVGLRGKINLSEGKDLVVQPDKTIGALFIDAEFRFFDEAYYRVFSNEEIEKIYSRLTTNKVYTLSGTNGIVKLSFTSKTEFTIQLDVDKTAKGTWTITIDGNIVMDYTSPKSGDPIHNDSRILVCDDKQLIFSQFGKSIFQSNLTQMWVKDI